MIWLRKNWYLILIGLFVFSWLKKHSKYAKGDATDPLNYVSNTAWISPSSLLSERRKAELNTVASNVYDSLRGISSNSKKQSFLSNMIKVNNDEEFDYMAQAFSVNRKKDLSVWIKREITLTKKWLDQVNLDYENKKMLTRV